MNESTVEIPAVRRFRGFEKCIRWFIAKHWSKRSLAGVNLDATGGPMSNERKAIAERTYAAQVVCWTNHMPDADEKRGRGGLTDNHLRILEVVYAPHSYSKEMALQVLCNELNLTERRLDIEKTHAEGVMANRFRFQQLLEDG